MDIKYIFYPMIIFFIKIGASDRDYFIHENELERHTCAERRVEDNNR